MGFRFCFASAVPSWGVWWAGPPWLRGSPRVRGSGVERERPLRFCAVLGKPIRWSHWLPPKRQVELPFRELRQLFTLGLQIFCLLTLVLFIVHDYGRLGCHFFQIPVWREELDFEDEHIYIAISKHLQCCSHFITKHLGLAFNKYCISL